MKENNCLNSKFLYVLILSFFISFNAHSESGCRPILKQLVAEWKSVDTYKKIYDRHLSLDEGGVEVEADKALKLRREKIEGYVDPAEDYSKEKITTKKIRDDFSKNELKYHWALWKDDPDIFRQVEYLKVMETTDVYRVDIYGSESFKQFKKADKILNDIPVGKLELTNDLVKLVNKELIAKEDTEAQFLSKLLPGTFALKSPGTFRARQVYGTPELLTEKEIEVLKANPDLGGEKFTELDKSILETIRKKGLWGSIKSFLGFKNKDLVIDEKWKLGYIHYADAEDVEIKMTELNDWANLQIKKIRANAEDAMDPIELAANYQRRFVSIHPLYDGNGRTSKLVLDRILREFGLPPAMFEESDWDIYYYFVDHVDKVRKAVYRGLKRYQIAYKERNTSKWQSGAPTLYKVNYKDTPVMRVYKEKFPAKYAKAVNHISENAKALMPKNNESEFFIGKERVLLLPDGFFYNKKGQPYLYNPDDKKLYPISHASYFLYGENGKVDLNLELRREMTPLHREMIENNLELVTKILDDKSFDATKQVESLPYELVNKANKEGTLKLYDFQKDMFKDVVSIKYDKDALDSDDWTTSKNEALSVLARYRGGMTTFERRWIAGEKVGLDEVIAQYKWVDLRFWNYQEYAKKHMPELLPEIDKSRQVLHRAGRVLLSKYSDKYSELSREAKKLVDRDPRINLFKKSWEYSKLNLDWYRKVLGTVIDDQYITLWRADYAISQYTGFVDESIRRSATFKINKAAKSLGFDLIKHLRETYAEWKQIKVDHLKSIDPNYKNQSDRILKHKSFRKLAEEDESFKEKLSLLNRLALRFTTLDLDYFLYDWFETLESRNIYKGVEEEFESSFVNLILHMTDIRANKLGTSWSVYSGLYVKQDKEQLYFPFVSKTESQRLYLRKMPKKIVSQNVYNTYFSQYEFAATKGYIWPRFVAFFRYKDVIKRKMLSKRPTIESAVSGRRKLLNLFGLFKSSKDIEVLAKQDLSQANNFLKESGFYIDMPEKGKIKNPNAL